MTPDQTILQEMGKVLGRLVLPEMSQIIFRGKVYEGFSGGMPFSVDDAGVETAFGGDGTLPMGEILELLDLAETLQQTPVFKASPFTHFELRLGRDLDMTLNLADIPESQNWDSLFMRPISALSQSEAEALHIPHEDWQACQEA